MRIQDKRDAQIVDREKVTMGEEFARWSRIGQCRKAGSIVRKTPELAIFIRTTANNNHAPIGEERIHRSDPPTTGFSLDTAPFTPNPLRGSFDVPKFLHFLVFQHKTKVYSRGCIIRRWSGFSLKGQVVFMQAPGQQVQKNVG